MELYYISEQKLKKILFPNLFKCLWVRIEWVENWFFFNCWGFVKYALQFSNCGILFWLISEYRYSVHFNSWLLLLNLEQSITQGFLKYCNHLTKVKVIRNTLHCGKFLMQSTCTYKWRRTDRCRSSWLLQTCCCIPVAHPSWPAAQTWRQRKTAKGEKKNLFEMQASEKATTQTSTQSRIRWLSACSLISFSSCWLSSAELRSFFLRFSDSSPSVNCTF